MNKMLMILGRYKKAYHLQSQIGRYLLRPQ